MQRARDELRRAFHPALALLTAFLIGGVIILLTDFEHLAMLRADPLGAIGGALSALLRDYGAMLTGALGDPRRIAVALETRTPEDIAAALRPLSETLVSATPFIFAGLGLAVSFRAGLINLGVDGQFLIGTLGTFIAAALVGGSLPQPLALAVAVVGGTLAGAAYGFVPGFLKASTGAHEVITTLMLNPIAGTLAFFVTGWIRLPFPPTVAPVPRLSDLPGIRVDLGFVAGLVIAAVVSWFLFRTTRGFELRATGLSRHAARVAGIQPGRAIVLAMVVSGGLVGMGSAFFGLGPAWGSPGVPEEQMGYVALALALIGGRRPGGVVASALLYGALTTGSETLVVQAGIPLALLTVIIAFAMLFTAAPELMRSVWRLGPSKRGAPADDPPAAGSAGAI